MDRLRRARDSRARSGAAHLALRRVLRQSRQNDTLADRRVRHSVYAHETVTRRSKGENKSQNDEKMTRAIRSRESRKARPEESRDKS